MKTHIIQLENHDDVISVRDKMSWSKAPRILLVWPRRGQVLGRQVDLFLLQRHAQTHGAQLAIVTQDGEARENALVNGIPTFSSTLHAQRGSWRKPRGKRKLPLRNLKPRVDPESLRHQRSVVRPERLENTWARIAAFTIGVLAVMAMLMFFLPSARVELSPLRQEQRLELSVWASPDIREVNPSGGMPAYALTVVVEGAEQIASSGTTGIPDRQASGDIVFSNLSENEIDIPAGTIVLTTGEDVQRFETTRAATLLSGVGQTVTAPARALLPGLAGNVPAEAIQAVEGPLGLEILVLNPEPLRGGGDRTSPAPTQDDYAAIEDRLVAALRATAIEDLSRQLTAGQRLVEGSLVVSEVLAETLEPAPGQPADFARISQQVEYTGYYVLESDLAAVALTALEANRAEGFQAQPGSLQIEFAQDGVIDESGVARWGMRVTRQLEANWSNDQAARALVGLSPAEATRRLNGMVALSAPPVVRLMPAWWLRMPFLSFRIEVVSQ